VTSHTPLSIFLLIFIHVVFLVFSSSSALQVFWSSGQLNLLNFASNFDGAGLAQRGLQSRYGRGGDGVVLGEFDLEFDEKSSLVENISVYGHTFVFNRLDISRLDHLTLGGRDENLSAIEMIDEELNTGEGLDETDLLVDDEVIAFSCKDVVFLDLEDDDDVSRDDVGVLIAFTVEGDLLTASYLGRYRCPTSWSRL